MNDEFNNIDAKITKLEMDVHELYEKTETFKMHVKMTDSNEYIKSNAFNIRLKTCIEQDGNMLDYFSLDEMELAKEIFLSYRSFLSLQKDFHTIHAISPNKMNRMKEYHASQQKMYHYQQQYNLHLL